MNKKFSFLLFVAALFTAFCLQSCCESAEDQPITPGGGGGGSASSIVGKALLSNSIEEVDVKNAAPYPGVKVQVYQKQGNQWVCVIDNNITTDAQGAFAISEDEYPILKNLSGQVKVVATSMDGQFDGDEKTQETFPTITAGRKNECDPFVYVKWKDAEDGDKKDPVTGDDIPDGEHKQAELTFDGDYIHTSVINTTTDIAAGIGSNGTFEMQTTMSMSQVEAVEASDFGNTSSAKSVVGTQVHYKVTLLCKVRFKVDGKYIPDDTDINGSAKVSFDGTVQPDKVSFNGNSVVNVNPLPAGVKSALAFDTTSGKYYFEISRNGIVRLVYFITGEVTNTGTTTIKTASVQGPATPASFSYTYKLGVTSPKSYPTGNTYLQQLMSPVLGAYQYSENTDYLTTTTPAGYTTYFKAFQGFDDMKYYFHYHPTDSYGNQVYMTLTKYINNYASYNTSREHTGGSN